MNTHIYPSGTMPEIPLANHANPKTLASAPAAPVMPANDYIRISEVCRITTLSRSTVYKLVREGQFPQPIKLSANTSVWERASVLAFMEAKKQASLSAQS